MFSANLQVPISSLDGAQIIESLKGQIKSTSYAVNKYFPAWRCKSPKNINI